MRRLVPLAKSKNIGSSMRLTIYMFVIYGANKETIEQNTTVLGSGGHIQQSTLDLADPRNDDGFLCDSVTT